MMPEIVRFIAWPVCILIIVLECVIVFRNSIKDLIPRLEKGDIQVSSKGFRLTFEQSLQAQIVQMDDQQADVKAIVDTSVLSQSKAVVLAWSLLEKKLRRIFAVSHWNNGKFTDIKTGLSILVNLGVFAPNSVQSFKVIEDEYNRILDHRVEGIEQNTEVAIITAVQLLRSLYALSLQDNIVQQVNIPMYSDKACTSLISDMTAVAIKQIMVDGITPSLNVFPTSRRDYTVVEHVTWDWNSSRILTNAWYRDPSTGEAKSINAMDFIGGNLGDL